MFTEKLISLFTGKAMNNVRVSYVKIQSSLKNFGKTIVFILENFSCE